MTTDERAPSSAPKTDVEQLTEGIEQTRAKMSATVGALEQRLSPSELGQKARAEMDHVEARMKVALKEGLEEARGVVEGQILAAKGAIHEEIVVAQGAVKEHLQEAKDMVTHGLSDAREAIKKDIHEAVVNTKQGIRDATLGRVEDLATQAGDLMNTTKDTLVDTIRQNPVPAALAGVGLAWLLMNRSSASRRGPRLDAAYDGGRDRRSRRSAMPRGAMGREVEGAPHAGGDAGPVAGRAGDAVKHVGSVLGDAGTAVAGMAHDAGDAARNVLGKGVEAASQLVSATGHAMHEATGATEHALQSAAGAAGHLAEGAGRSFHTTLEANPLALGAVAAVAGAVVGYSLPRTHQEDALMGEMRDHVIEGATHIAHDAAQSLQHMAAEGGEKAKAALNAKPA